MTTQSTTNSSVEDSSFCESSPDSSLNPFEALEALNLAVISQRELRYLRRTQARILQSSDPTTLSKHSNKLGSQKKILLLNMALNYNFA